MALEVAGIGLILPVIQIFVLGKQDGVLTELLLSILPRVSQDNPGLWIAGLFGLFFVVKNFSLIGLIYIVNRVVAIKTALYTKKIFNIYSHSLRNSPK